MSSNPVNTFFQTANPAVLGGIFKGLLTTWMLTEPDLCDLAGLPGLDTFEPALFSRLSVSDQFLLSQRLADLLHLAGVLRTRFGAQDLCFLHTKNEAEEFGGDSPLAVLKRPNGPARTLQFLNRSDSLQALPQ